MATKLYLPSGAGSGLPTISGSTPTWDNTGAVESDQRMSTTKSNSTMTTTGQKYGDATSGFRTHLIKRFISRPVAAQTISGDVQLQLRCAESSTSLNATLAIAVYRINSSGVYQDTLLSVSYSDSSSSPYEMVTSLTNRRAHDSSEDYTIPLTSRTFSAGDMIVVEIGFAESNTSTSRYATFSFGDDSSTDLGDNTTDTAAYNPWVNFSQTITFQTNVVTATASGGATLSSTTASATRVIPATTSVSSPNILSSNQASGTDTLQDTTGFGDFNSTISSSTAEYHSGSRSLKATTLNQAYSGAKIVNISIPSKVTKYFPSIWIKGPNISKYLYIQIWANSSGQIAYGQAYPTGDWQRLYCTEQSDTSLSDTQFDVVIGWLETPGAAYDLYIDDAMVEESTTLHDWVAPGNISSGGVLSGTASATRVFEGTTLTIGKNKIALNVANGSENGTIDGITDGIYTVVTSSTANPYSGSRAIRCTFDGSGAANGWVMFYADEAENKIPVTEGQSYAFQFQGAGSTLAQIIGIDWYNSSNSYISSSESNFTGSSGYTKRTKVATAPTGAVYAVPYWQPGVNSAMTVDLDEIMFEQGSSASAFELPGDVSSGGVLSGIAEGTVTSYSTVSGTISATSGTTGAINVTKNVAGTITPSSTVTGTLTNTRNVAGTINSQSGTTGAVNRIFSVSGTIGALSGATGTVIKVTNVSGTIGAISGITGNPTLTRRVIGSITGISGSSGTAKLLGALQGTISATSGVTGTLTRTRTAEGTITAQSGLTGTINRIISVAGTINALTTLTGTAQLVAGFKYAEGLITATSGLTGTTKLFRGVTGTISANSGTTASINVLKNVIGTITAQSGTTGTLNNLRKVAGTITPTSTVTGTLNNLRKVAGTINSQSTVTGDALVSAWEIVSGTISATTTVTGSINVLKTVTGTINATTTTTGTINLLRQAQGAISAISTLTGTTTRTRIAEGTITAQSNLTGAITRIISVSGLISATTTLIGSVLKLVGLPDQHATFTLKKNNTTFTLKQNNTSFSIKKLGITIDRKGD